MGRTRPRRNWPAVGPIRQRVFREPPVELSGSSSRLATSRPAMRPNTGCVVRENETRNVQCRTESAEVGCRPEQQGET